MAEDNYISWDEHIIEHLKRDSLKLTKINKNGTLSEMIDTINTNFQALAEHGGGPSGIDGINGLNGEDGVNVEYIYALCDEMKETYYPADVNGKYALFNTLRNSDSTTYNGFTWYNHAQPISIDNKNEYVLCRYRRNIEGEEETASSWNYDSSPILWAHWGETGKDGDGVEYIFMTSNIELTQEELESATIKRSSLNDYQKVIYNIDDFYPGSGWFGNATNKAKAKEEFDKEGITISDSQFDIQWSNKFGFTAYGEWTDNPSGVGPNSQYEYVSVRRSRRDENDRKEWGDYSTPALWSNYTFEGRIFIIYCNTAATARPTAPTTGSGWWDVENNRLIFSPDASTGADPIPQGWTDTNINTNDGEITWMCSGIFNHTGENLSWSNPACISGKDGKNGEDGTTIEFIYALSTNPSYPTNRAEMEALFNAVENDEEHNPKYSTYHTTKWYDRAQPISAHDTTEYMWARRREKETDPWEYDPQPFIWSHWGEDGTDGDGVEYIFAITSAENPSALRLPKIATMTDEQKKIFQIDDFVPSREWFAKPRTKGKVQEVLGADFDETKWARYYDFNLSTGWRDDPIPVDPFTPFQWVSIRRSTADEYTGKRLWEDFSDPVLWNSYGKSTRVFIIYCNMPVDEEHPDKEIPNKPLDETGVWVNTDGQNYLNLNDVVDALTDVTEEQRALKIGVWSDKNDDVRGTISWMCSGIFTDDGCNVSWTEPFRISGEKGEPGEDGDNMEYIYCLSDTKPSFPPVSQNMTDAQYDDLCKFFYSIDKAQDANIYNPSDPVNEGIDIEHIKIDENNVLYYEYTDGNGTTAWYDHPQSVDEEVGKRTEWVWMRTKAFDDNRWTFMPEPAIWSHWGEDGTDGDGVEYIFHLSTQEVCPVLEYPPVKPEPTSEREKCRSAIYNIRDFYPGKGWFTNDTDGDGKVDGKEDAKAAIVDGGILSLNDFNQMWNNEISSARYFNLDCDWTDNPQETTFFLPFQFVSIRKSYTNNKGQKEWGPYSTPKIWSRHLIQSRVFMIYCNIPIVPNEEERQDGELIVPTAPDLNYGWWDGDDRLYAAQPAEGESGAPYEAPAYNSEATSTRVGTWSDTDEDVPNTITWLCSITFAENGMAISCSEPFRITGARGYRGVDGADIEFIYTRCDVEADLKYPNPANMDTNPTVYNNVMALFDGVENSTNKEEGRKYYEYQGMRWYDNPMGVAAETNKIKEWVWSRSKTRGITLNPTPNWTVPPKPIIWAHWGEDGTDGDGVEYIFMLSNKDSYQEATGVNASTWTSYWTACDANATARAAYSMDDFLPQASWFTEANKTAVQQKMHDEELGTFNNSHWNTLKGKSWSTLGVWTDNPGDVSPQQRFQYVAIRKSENGVWGPFSYPAIWSSYSSEKFTSFAFTATETDVDLSSITPSGGTFANPVPNATTTGGKTYNWTDGPQPTPNNGRIIIWMTSAVVKEGENITGWTKPQKMIDESGFQVEWCAAATITTAQKNSLESNTYNFETYMKNANYNESNAESAWRSAVSSNLGLTFSDNATNAVYMATCYVKNSVWTNWKVAKIRGEDGDSVTRKYAQYNNSWGVFKEIVGINSTGTTVTFKDVNNTTHTKSTTNSPLGADEDHCIEVMSERIGDGTWSLPIISSKYFNQDEIGDMVNATLTDANGDLVDFVERHAGEQISEALGPYAITEDIQDWVNGNYVASATFTSYKSDASKKFAQVETITGNAIFAQDSNGHYIYKNNGQSSNYSTFQEYYNSLSTADKNEVDPYTPKHGLNDPTVVENLINKMKTVFRLTYSEIALVKQSVGDKVAMTDIITAVSTSTTQLYGAIQQHVSDKVAMTDIITAVNNSSSQLYSAIRQQVSDKASMTEIITAVSNSSSQLYSTIRQTVSDKASKTELTNAISTLSSNVTAQITQAVSDKASKTELSNAISTLSSSVTARITQAVSDKASVTQLNNAISTLSSNVTAQITQAVSDKASVTQLNNAISTLSSSVTAQITQAVSDKASMTQIVNAINSGTSTSIQAAITAYANKSGSGITLDADRINLSASKKLNVTTDNFSITSSNFTLNEGGLTLKSKNGKTEIKSDGTLVAQNAVISGTVTANKFSATSGNRKTTIDGSSFQIKDTSSNNSIFISIENSISDGNGGTRTNVPTLCMIYNGEKYILDPSNWLASGQDSSAMGFNLVNNLLTYRIASTISNATSGTSSSMRYSWFRNQSDNITEYGSTAPSKLYRFYVDNLGNATTTATNLSNIKTYLLSASTATNLSTVNSTGAYTWNSVAGDYAGITTPITAANCSTFKGVLKDTWTYQSNYNFGLECNDYYEYDRDSGSTIPEKYGLRKMYNFIMYYYGLTGQYNTDWLWNNYHVEFADDFAQLFSFDYTNASSGTSYTGRQQDLSETAQVSADIFAYPIITLGSYGKTLNSVNQIFVKCTYHIFMNHGSGIQPTYGYRIFTSSTPVTPGYPQPGPPKLAEFEFTLSFNLILTLNTAISVSDMDTLKTTVLSRIDTFLKNFNYNSNSTSIRDKVQISAHTILADNTYTFFTLNM